MSGTFIIDPEFSSLIPPLSTEEYRALEDSLLSEGCRDALVVWNTALIDGNNRYAICQEHGIEFQTVEREFEDRDAAKLWIIDNQLARRNLPPYERGRLALLRKPLVAAEAEKRMKAGKLVPVENFPQGKTRDVLAKEINVSGRTLDKIEAVEKGAPEPIKKKARSGELSVNRAYQLTKTLVNAPQDVIEMVDKWDVDDPSVVEEIKQVYEYPATRPIIEEANKTGKIQVDETRSVSLNESPVKLNDAIKQLTRKLRQQEIRKQREEADPLPEGIYNLLYADPPWQYEHVVTPSRDIENQYPTMSLEDICALPVTNFKDKDAVLFLWTPSALIRQALQVVEAWGFEYRTNFVWVKDRIGMGYFTRQRHELLFVATRGNWRSPDPENRMDSVIESPRGAHSVKPPCVYDLIEKMYPTTTKLEMFSRNDREGWARWGNEK